MISPTADDDAIAFMKERNGRIIQRRLTGGRTEIESIVSEKIG